MLYQNAIATFISPPIRMNRFALNLKDYKTLKAAPPQMFELK
jgi:hypothetical protein